MKTFVLLVACSTFQVGIFAFKQRLAFKMAVTLEPEIKKARQSLDVRIHDKWYDLSGWRQRHPAGEHWIDLYKNRDATEVVHAFHSEEAMKMFESLPKSKNAVKLENESPRVSQLSLNFRKLRLELERDGWWQRDYFHEAKLIGIWASLFASGLFFAKSVPIAATFLLALANTAAGWIGHDYIHGVDKFSFSLRNFASFAAGMSPTWWSDKHNKHHAVPNEVGVDEDLATEPFLYVYPPAPKKDSFMRKIQHWVMPVPFSFLFILWRLDSAILCFKDALSGFKRKTYWETLLQIAHYSILVKLVPLPVVVGQLLLAGFVTAIIVTVTHQSEDLFFEHNDDFVDSQFRSTRNAKCRNAFTSWLWGGMQWQLEHHLFPSMVINISQILT